MQSNPGGENVAYDLLVQPDDRALLVGALQTPASSQLPRDGTVALARYLVCFDLLGRLRYRSQARLMLENYDRGGEGVAFHDTDAVNQGGAYRIESADVQAIPMSSGGGHALAFALAGEWAEYTVDAWRNRAITTSPSAPPPSREAAPSTSPSTIRSLISQTAVPTTGDWQKYTTLKLGSRHLTAGVHVVRLTMVRNDATGYVGNFDRLDFVRRNDPYNGGVGVAPGQLIQAENFDKGGEGVAYHDSEPANFGPSADNYRPADGVDIEPAADTGGGYNVGYARAGEWLEYGVDAFFGSTYALDVRLASLLAGGRFHVTLDGVGVASFTVPATGSWQTYTTLSSPKNVYVPEGIHTLRLTMDTEQLDRVRRQLQLDAVGAVGRGPPPGGVVRSPAEGAILERSRAMLTNFSIEPLESRQLLSDGALGFAFSLGSFGGSDSSRR